MATPAQINANRANAQLSTGPKSESGKAISSKNVVTTGLTGRTVLLATEDAAPRIHGAFRENRHKHFDPSPFGFEFSHEQLGHMKRCAMALYPRTYIRYLDRPPKAAW